MTFWYVIGTDLTFFELFKLLFFTLGLITTPHVLYVHMTYVYSFFSMSHSSHDHMAKRSHYRIMIFYRLRSSTLRTHPHPHFLPLPPQPHHPYTPRLCRSTTAQLEGGYHPVARYGHPEDPDCT